MRWLKVKLFVLSLPAFDSLAFSHSYNCSDRLKNTLNQHGDSLSRPLHLGIPLPLLSPVSLPPSPLSSRSPIHSSPSMASASASPITQVEDTQPVSLADAVSPTLPSSLPIPLQALRPPRRPTLSSLSITTSSEFSSHDDTLLTIESTNTSPSHSSHPLTRFLKPKPTLNRQTRPIREQSPPVLPRRPSDLRPPTLAETTAVSRPLSFRKEQEERGAKSPAKRRNR